MAAQYPLKIIISAVDQLTKPLAQAMGQVNKFGKQLQGMGQALSFTLSAPTAFVGRSILKTAVDFEAAMRDVQGYADAAAQDMTALRQAALDMSAGGKAAPLEIAEGMISLGKQGKKTAEILMMMPPVLDASLAAGESFGETMNIVTGALNAFGLAANRTQETVDILGFVANSTKADIPLMGESLKNVASVAKLANVDFRTVAAALGILSQNNIEAEKAGTGLKIAFNRLMNPLEEARTGMQLLNLPFRQLSLSQNDFIPVLNKIGDAYDRLKAKNPIAADVAIGKLFGSEAASSILVLLQQRKAFAELDEAAQNASGSIAKLANMKLGGASGAIKELKANWEIFKITLADSGLLYAFTELTKQMTAWVKAMNAASPRTLWMATVLAGLVVVLGPLTLVLGGVLTVFSTGIGILMRFGGALKWLVSVLYRQVIVSFGSWMMQIARFSLGVIMRAVSGIIILLRGAFVIAIRTAIGWIAAFGAAFFSLPVVGQIALIVAAVVGAAYMIYRHWSGIKVFFRNLWASVQDSTRQFIDWFVGAWNDVLAVFSRIGDKISGIYKGIIDLPKNNVLTRGWDKVTNFGEGAMRVGQVQAMYPPATQNIDDMIQRFYGALPAMKPAEAKVTVNFENAPPGMRTKVAPGSTARVDLSQGVAMGGAW
ncbi:hypothetical protein VF14_18395 [Nostoc linckia z18]|uniref:Phage tail tape measure protein domain-containing protein n=2 Tax=Nostoc linckia TaxID=92942 RepID=A0A9Q6EJH1_NOSLI|nr:phage tail tape measure protein [Nostoc linckia]PHJ81965.1 hypothetical protein VF07_29135 [Nostoc linckia z6]PHJ92863.1 hypothetical protein VF04_27850 [Nostoc linckia z7]PHK00814.1 hypothetical protein VF08_23395 [Nostoc linckia z8]PHK09308.1 hypothetical protein VF09_15910 [Nostoc linckia z9]PHK33088.1 hypothetical protein VF14_18395 [Nostoc linckia z18]